MICRIFLFMGITKIFKNTHNFCGTFVAHWSFEKMCHEIQYKQLIINM